jgi:hypothetical protein
MSRYFVRWEIDRNRLAKDPKEIASNWKQLTGLVRQHLEMKRITEWGAFPGEHAGYCVMEGSEADVMNTTMQYAPHVTFHVRPLTTIKEVSDFINEASR